MNENGRMGLLLAGLTLLILLGFFYFNFMSRDGKKVPNPTVPTIDSLELVSYLDIEQAEIDQNPVKLRPKVINLLDDIAVSLNVPDGYKIYPAAQGLRRVRFFAKAPDNRLFVTGMYNLSDNKRGKVYILDEFDEARGKFRKITVWKDKLRNPNSVQFYTDETGQDWLYLAVTDSLVRYKYQAGELEPSDKGEKIFDFPGDGLNYKYGGWHLTRTIAFHEDKLYVSVGSSCNLCEEKPEEPTRATILQMNPDGSNFKVFANGLRNAVDLQWVEGKLYATNMAADHLGNDKPNDYFYQIEENEHYGWPYCYEQEGEIVEETAENASINKVKKKIVKSEWERKGIACANIPKAYTLFAPHSSPLGFEYFEETTLPELKNYFVAALHGATRPKKGRRNGHQIVRFKKGHPAEVLVDGFLVGNNRIGRPCDIIQKDENSFFFSDDLAGIIYYVKGPE